MFPSLRRAAGFLLALAPLVGTGAQAQVDSRSSSADGEGADVAAAVATLPIGINVRPVTPFDRAWVFADAMRLASEWTYAEGSAFVKHRVDRKPGGTPEFEPVPLDENGWPRPTFGRKVYCQFFVGMRGKFPAGQYVITWKGKGKVTFTGGSGVVSEQPNRTVVTVDSVSGGQPGLEVSGFDPSDPIREIHVWLPNLEDSCHTFHPLFLERLRPFSVLRFYQWMRVYTSTGRWRNRPTMRSARQAGPEGVAAEYMVELCNDLVADPWFCIPHTADDDWVRNFATLVRESLRHDAKVYVEFSNETWNTDFAAGKWAREQAQRLGIPAMQVVAQRATQVFAIWQDVFGAQKDRIVRVAGVQLHNPGIANSMCRAMNGNFDAIAVGAYFGVRADRDAVDKSSSAAQLMSAAIDNLKVKVLPRIRDHRNLAAKFTTDYGHHVALLTYEGGQSIVARSPGGGLDASATFECQNMPEMFAAYRTLIDGASALGVELFVAYDFVGTRTDADTFSVLEYIQQPVEEAAKYRALIQGWETRGQ